MEDCLCNGSKSKCPKVLEKMLLSGICVEDAFEGKKPQDFVMLTAIFPYIQRFALIPLYTQTRLKDRKKTRHAIPKPFYISLSIPISLTDVQRIRAMCTHASPYHHTCCPFEPSADESLG